MISDKAVEAAARALYKGQPIYDEAEGVITGYKPWEWMEPAYQDAMLADARAALEAALPLLSESAMDARLACVWDEVAKTIRDDTEIGQRIYVSRRIRANNPHRSQA